MRCWTKNISKLTSLLGGFFYWLEGLLWTELFSTPFGADGDYSLSSPSVPTTDYLDLLTDFFLIWMFQSTKSVFSVLLPQFLHPLSLWFSVSIGCLLCFPNLVLLKNLKGYAMMIYCSHNHFTHFSRIFIPGHSSSFSRHTSFTISVMLLCTCK